MLPLLTFTVLLERFAATVQGSAAAALDFTVGSVVRALGEAVASVCLWLQWLIFLVAQKIRAATCVGSDLDTWMADFGLLRLPAVAAEGTVTFSRFTPSTIALIPVGTAVKTADGLTSYLVIADTTQTCWSAGNNGYLIPAGIASANATVQAMTAGSSGNAIAGFINLISTAISGVDTVTNALAFIDGMDPETDIAFRARFALFIALLSRATLAAIQYAVALVQVGLTMTIQENVSTAGAAQMGNFVVTVDDGSGSPPSTLLTAIGTSVNLYRPVGTTFAIQAPTVVPATVVLTITVASPGVKALLQPIVQSAISAYINAGAMGATLLLTRLYVIAYWVDPTIANVSGLTINGVATDLAIAAGQVAKAGTVTVN